LGSLASAPQRTPQCNPEIISAARQALANRAARTTTTRRKRAHYSSAVAVARNVAAGKLSRGANGPAAPRASRSAPRAAVATANEAAAAAVATATPGRAGGRRGWGRTDATSSGLVWNGINRTADPAGDGSVRTRRAALRLDLPPPPRRAARGRGIMASAEKEKKQRRRGRIEKGCCRVNIPAFVFPSCSERERETESEWCD
jgi:hypothetical protein